MPTQIFSLRIMDDDDDDDDDDDGVRKQIDGAFPLSLLRLPTHRPSILSNSRRRRRHRISVVLNGAEDFFQRVVVFRVFSTSIIVLCLWRFFHFFHSPKIRAIDLFGIFLIVSIFSRQNLHFFGHFVCARDEIFLIFFFFSPLFSNFFCLL